MNIATSKCIMTNYEAKNHLQNLKASTSSGILASVTRILCRIKRYLPADEKNLEESTSDMLVLKYAAVKMATCNFSNDKFGEGVFGLVFKWICAPEYVRRGIYSMKYDVYSFGVLLL
ncbi:hypothetical protein K1719_002923 [Acacia pycnantha]|nr:hypothetical protein K1719_002923 [Acacia pycnantha]